MVPLTVEFDPLALELGDFDGDGAIDAFVSGTFGGLVRGAILYGVGDGTLSSPIAIDATGCSAYPAVGSLDGNGSTDIVMAACNGQIAVWRGDVSRTLVPWTEWAAQTYPNMRTSVIADFAGDGNGDLFTLRVVADAPGQVWIDRTAAGISIQHVTGFDLATGLPAGFDPNALALGMLDDDGIRDVVVTDREHGLARAHGDAFVGTFVDPEAIDVDISPWTTLVGDLDGDALDDVVVTARAEQSVQVLVNDGAAGLAADSPLHVAGLSPYDAALGDVDGDGALDLVLVDDGQSVLVWMRGDGAGGLTVADVLLLPSPAIRVHVADLDGNGFADVVAATFAAGSLSVSLAG
ncbi:MAG TPA: VCBS repeat-containing protein [Nannocystaceae bacterium]|nr:VCBS repeat-containing protein [Nannocystaceae bacterium]